MNRTLIVFAREPVAGRTKTRLCPPLDGAAAARLYACFLGDVLGIAGGVAGARVLLAHTPDSSPAWFAAFAPGVAATPQRGAGLGERMDNAFAEAFAADDRRPTADDGRREARDTRRETRDLRHEMRDASASSPCLPVSLSPCLPVTRSVVVIGSDSPDMPADYIAEAFARLEAGAGVVLGPCADGGYYLIGLRARQPRLLRDVPMSTPTVLADTLALARAQGLRAGLLPPWHDVDTAADLRALAARLRATPPEVAPRTRAFLAEPTTDDRRPTTDHARRETRDVRRQ